MIFGFLVPYNGKLRMATVRCQLGQPGSEAVAVQREMRVLARPGYCVLTVRGVS